MRYPSAAFSYISVRAVENFVIFDEMLGEPALIIFELMVFSKRGCNVPDAIYNLLLPLFKT